MASLPIRWQPAFLAAVVEGKPPKVFLPEQEIARGTYFNWTASDKWRAAAKEVLAILARARLQHWERLNLLADQALGEVLAADNATDRDRLKAAEIVLDRSGLPAGKTLAASAAESEPIPPLHTPEGREALIAQLASELPEDLLLEAVARRRASAPAHLQRQSESEE